MSTGNIQQAPNNERNSQNEGGKTSRFENDKIPQKRLFFWVLLIGIMLVGGTVILMSLDDDNNEVVEPTTSISGEIDDIDWSIAPPCSPDDLSDNWEEITDQRMRANSNRRKFRNKHTGETINFDLGDPTQTGEKAKDHWHRDNPNKKNKRNQYLDEHGNEVGKNSPESHIKPKCD